MYLAVCDDREEDLHHIQALLAQWQEDRHTLLQIRSFRSASDLLDSAARSPFSLYLLDVMMPGLDGLSAARELRSFDATAPIVFLTTSPGFAYESYRVHALDYLLKPIRPEELFPILDRLQLQEQQSYAGVTLKSGGTLTHIPFSQLAYVEVTGRRLHFNLADGTVHEVNGTLSEYADELLSRPEFIRIHRAYILNMYQVAQLSAKDVQLLSGKVLPISRLLATEVQQKYMQLMFDRREDTQ